MKNILQIFLIYCFSLFVISCASSSDDGASTTTTTDNDTTTDTTAPVLAEVTAVTTPTNDTTPDYTFSSSESGTITYGGSCSSSTTSATTDNNTITLVSLSEGTYSNCAITVTDSAGNSVTLNISSFVIDTTVPTVSSTSPSNGTITDDVNSFSATFSDVVDNTTLTTSTFTVTDNSSNSVSGTVSSSDNTSANNTTVTFTPSGYIHGNYTATVSNAVKDLAGNSLAQNYSWSFEINWLGTKQLGQSMHDFGTGVATDSSGNVYVTGKTGGGLDGNTFAGSSSSNYDLFVVKYNSNGEKQWTKQLGTSGIDEATGIATDSSGNVYVTGTTGGGLDGNTSAGNKDLFVVKYNDNGTKQWTKQLGTSSDDEAKGVATDSSGNVYVTGKTGGGLDGNTYAGSYDLFVVKYNDNGTKQWTKQLGTSNYDGSTGVATDSSGNVYVTGRTGGGLDGNTSAGNYDVFVVKYYDNGTKQWTKQLGTSNQDLSTGVATDSSGNVYVTGTTAGGLDGSNAGANDLFVVKYYDNGTKQWTKQLGSSNAEFTRGVATDSSGNVYVVGYTLGALDGNTYAGSYDPFLFKYNSSGTKQWTKQFGTSNVDEAIGVATDSSGNVYVTGYTGTGMDGNTSAGNYDLFVVKYYDNGTKQ